MLATLTGSPRRYGRWGARVRTRQSGSSGTPFRNPARLDSSYCYQILTNAGMAKLKTSGNTPRKLPSPGRVGDEAVGEVEVRHRWSKERERECPSVASRGSSGTRSRTKLTGRRKIPPVSRSRL